MSNITWSQELEIGVPILDQQHKALMHALARLEDVAHGKGRAEVETSLEDLAKHAKGHLDTELRLMAAYDFPENRSAPSHIRLVDDVAKLNTAYRSGSRDLDPRNIASLKSWLARHINEDKKLAVYLNSANSAVNLANQIIVSAYEAGVSDIHIDSCPGKMNTRVRFRKDGTLYDHLELPAGSHHAFVSRIKIMADLDISERRKPQDGRIEFSKFGPAPIELRVATIPTAGGMENVVMRLLSTAKLIPIDQLDLCPQILGNLKEIALKPYGLFIVCGPTGSGKTTTLHSILSYINTPERKIWTAEDPIEITQVGLSQVQVNPRIGWTFVNAMRSLLRADPDVIMVGEMRDQETTKMTIEASLTGHLVFSTLHTNSAPESVVRLLDLGVDRFNFSDALLGVLAQRLTKRLCGACKRPYLADADEAAELLGEYCTGTPLDPKTLNREWKTSFGDEKGRITLYRAQGCPRCHGTGYAGRVALHELLCASGTIRRLVQTGARVDEIRDAGVREGMRTLKQSGIERVLRGDTDIHQVRCVCV